MTDLTTAKQVKTYCTKIGSDPLLVQGAGGNISWKDGEMLWIKASGTWLAHAEKQEIFIPVNLAHLRLKIAEENFSVAPKVLGDSSLKPSIETILHALMPHKIVVHLHAIEILAHLVRKTPLQDFKKLIGDAVKWVFVDYFKPGAELAQAVSMQLAKHHGADVVFLKNHGLVIGGDDIKGIEFSLSKLLSLLQNNIHHLQVKTQPPEFMIDGYVPSKDKEVNKLATVDELTTKLETDWALYPDHVVFLGEKATIIKSSLSSYDLYNISITKPPFVFVVGKGVYESTTINDAQRIQLRCYYEVLTRQVVSENLESLTSFQVAELLNWEAEKYRISVSS
ncbi:MAG: class II aldolase [Spirobacillus cienkowskii]|jgi:rhamnose utilization protein RhaD (predicted bifunctional aldolase and dehydrogenase)|uniref:Class II aldolase n=1 Tax=Spirobacillus cienkowskii TaxID=495820 RepID=A0A369KTK9_9BACT|nr:MAG: class II aldolase [Spirobacillus cienkowskii]